MLCSARPQLVDAQSVSSRKGGCACGLVSLVFFWAHFSLGFEFIIIKCSLNDSNKCQIILGIWQIRDSNSSSNVNQTGDSESILCSLTTAEVLNCLQKSGAVRKR